MTHYLFVVPTLGGGGAERVVSVLASELTKFARVTILAYFHAAHEYERDQAVKVIYLTETEHEYDNLNYYYRLRSIRRNIKNEQPDYVIPFLSHVCMQVTVALIGTNLRVIQTVRNDPATLPSSPFIRILRDCFIGISYKTIVQNIRQKEYFKKYLWKKIYVMPNPVREDLFDIKKSKIRNGVCNIIAVGRLSKQKNYELLINSIAEDELIRKYCELRIFGDGELRNDLQTLIDSHNLTDKVKLCGRSDDMKSVYSNADMFIMTSDFEGMPNALMEAMAAGLPCVSTDCPTGPSELIINGDNGILIGINNKIQLRDAIKTLINDEDMACLMGNKARCTINSQYTPHHIARIFTSICEDKIN